MCVGPNYTLTVLITDVLLTEITNDRPTTGRWKGETGGYPNPNIPYVSHRLSQTHGPHWNDFFCKFLVCPSGPLQNGTVPYGRRTTFIRLKFRRSTRHSLVPVRTGLDWRGGLFLFLLFWSPTSLSRVKTGPVWHLVFRLTRRHGKERDRARHDPSRVERGCPYVFMEGGVRRD